MLHNTVWKLQQEKELTIGYYGGSITEGAGQSAPGFCYRDRVTAWLKAQYPDAAITEIQAAIGGTGSDLGMYRCGRDLLMNKPDLVFYEFAVNDSGMSYEAAAAQTETIFRKIWSANPLTDIVVLYTITGMIHDTLAKGGEYVSRAAHAAVARHYGIPAVDIGEALRTRTLLAGSEDFTRYAKDRVHPNDEGYTIYTDCLTDWLQKHLAADSDGRMPHTLPQPLCPKVYESARLEDCMGLTDCAMKGFTLVQKSLCGRYPHYIAATTPGATLRFTFQGENAGVYWMLAKDAGDVIVQVDNGAPKTIRSWDHYCRDFNRAGAAFFAKDLPYGTHSVTVTVADTKDEGSEGYAIRIGAVLVS